MKKLLIMASMFWPQKKSGGPPVSIYNLVKQIYHNFDLYIISRNHELNETEKLPGIENGWNTFEFGRVYYFCAGENTVKNIYAIIKEVEPDVIYQNSFFSYDDVFSVLLYKKQNPKVKVIVAPRGEFYPNRFSVGVVKKTIYSQLLRRTGMLKNIYFQGTGSDESSQIASLLNVDKKHIYNVQNLSLVSDKVSSIDKAVGDMRLCYIARIHPTKNTLKAIEWLSDIQGNTIFDIYGSIENEEYWNRCLEEINHLPNNIKVHYYGVIDHEKVEDTIAQYHAYYMPTTGENFGHSIVEAMLLGRMVLISDQTPWTDVNNYGGFAIPLNKGDEYKSALNEISEMSNDEYSSRCSKIHGYISEKLCILETIKGYVDMFQENGV